MKRIDKKVSTFSGNKLTVSVFGASHDEKIGVTVSGLNKGDKIDEEILQKFLDRRKPSASAFSTPRKESDKVIFESGIENGVFSGEELTAIIKNENQHSADYGEGVVLPRPSHADYVASVTYGNTFDHRGGGKFSGRLTAPMCIAGGMLKQLLLKKGIKINAYLKSVGNITLKGYDDIDVEKFDFSVLENSFPILEKEREEEIKKFTETVRSNGDSVGGIIEVVVQGLPVGAGEYMFSSLEGAISQLVFAVPAIKGIEFGLGFNFGSAFGSEVNDAFYIENGVIKTKTNNNGGINGGLSNGMPITFRVAVKPTPSIAIEQDTVNLKTMKNDKITVGGRHDSCIAIRAVPVLEAVTAIAIYDNLND